MSPTALLVEVERSGVIESTHPIDVAVVDAPGALVAWAGDPGTVAYLRSSAKPIQALACLRSGWTPPGTEQLAVACASHNGEPEHLAAVRGTLAAAGVAEDELRCPVAWPSAPEVVAAAGSSARILHNCSGKHAAMLATCAANGWPLDDYRDGEHPLQRAVTAAIESLAGRAARSVGIDGCGVPTFAFTLEESAATFAALGAAAASDERARAALDAMAAHPFLVAGTGRLCTAVMTAIPNVAIKIGAEGLACVVSRTDGRAFALKVRDGAQRARDAAVVAVLQMLGIAGDPTRGALAPHARPAVAGGDGTVGVVRCRGELETI